MHSAYYIIALLVIIIIGLIVFFASKKNKHHDVSKSIQTLALPLTDREFEVARLMSYGWENKEIADQLNISAKTIEVHVASILRKSGCRNRTAFARLAGENRLFHGELIINN